MQFSKYYLILLSIGFTTLVISNKHNQTANAQSFRTKDSSQERVGYNQQMAYSLGAANRAQQAHYFEQAKFAENAKELSQAGFNLADNDNYELTLESEDNAAFIYGIPLQKYGTYKEP